MNEGVITVLRNTRAVLQVLAEPIDLVGRLLNRKHGYPPLWLRQHSGDLRDFEGSGGEYTAYLKLLCGMKKGDSLLDLGCGCGLMALDVTGAGSLLDYLGTYVGLDIDRRAIDWCRKNLVSNNAYFGVGALVWGKGGLPCEDNSFDVVLAKSLFTHLLPQEVEAYLGEIKRVLVPNGKCLSTWFLLNGRKLKGRCTFKFHGSVSAMERITKPRLAVAYDEEWLMGKIGEAGLVAEYPLKYGTWTGDNEGLSFQDIIVMEKQK